MSTHEGLLSQTDGEVLTVHSQDTFPTPDVEERICLGHEQSPLSEIRLTVRRSVAGSERQPWNSLLLNVLILIQSRINHQRRRVKRKTYSIQTKLISLRYVL